MHVLFEGVVPLELKLLLHELMRKKYFNLEVLNSRIQSFTYGNYCHVYIIGNSSEITHLLEDSCQHDIQKVIPYIDLSVTVSRHV